MEEISGITLEATNFKSLLDAGIMKYSKEFHEIKERAV